MRDKFLNALKKNPCIAAVKDEEHLQMALESDCEVVFLLCASVFNLRQIVERVKSSGKLIFIHIDLIDGFSRDATALRYICENMRPDGIISTKNNLLKAAGELGLLTVQRLFIIDSMSIDTTIKTSRAIKPDAVEILPGIMPSITKSLSARLEVPIIVGGLVSDREAVRLATENGALGVSTSCSALWTEK